jgi:hypothetical protein
LIERRWKAIVSSHIEERPAYSERAELSTLRENEKAQEAVTDFNCSLSECVQILNEERKAMDKTKKLFGKSRRDEIIVARHVSAGSGREDESSPVRDDIR